MQRQKVNAKTIIIAKTKSKGNLETRVESGCSWKLCALLRADSSLTFLDNYLLFFFHLCFKRRIIWKEENRHMINLNKSNLFQGFQLVDLRRLWVKVSFLFNKIWLWRNIFQPLLNWSFVFLALVAHSEIFVLRFSRSFSQVTCSWLKFRKTAILMPAIIILVKSATLTKLLKNTKLLKS